MDKIPVDSNNSNGAPPPTTERTGSLLGFIGEALRTRLYETFLKPPTFIYSPPRQPSSSDHSRSSSGNRRQDRGDLNYPFAPISPSIPSSADANQDEICVLEGKISELEDSMKNMLSSENVPPPPQPPPPEQIVSNRIIPYEELEALVLPPFPQMKDKMHPSVYQELLAIYESQILMTGGGVPDVNVGKENITSSTTTQARGEDGDKQQCKNREKNLRSEVLKWNKD